MPVNFYDAEGFDTLGLIGGHFYADGLFYSFNDSFTGPDGCLKIFEVEVEGYVKVFGSFGKLANEATMRVISVFLQRQNTGLNKKYMGQKANNFYKIVKNKPK